MTKLPRFRLPALAASLMLMGMLSLPERPIAPADSLPAAGSRTDSVRTPSSAYIWPTDASTKITSEFAEYRSTHFHGGIDISTNGVKGYKVFAVNDGYVYKVRITPNGYGKMLFIMHDDGYISTYAHLQGFNETITQAVRKEQYRRGTYAIDLSLPPAAIRVHKGDVVAFTGDSGFGPPHLHFEFRERDLDPVNPFLIARYPIDDAIPPRIRRVLISPLTFNSTVDNNAKPKILGRFPRGKDGLKVPQQFLLHGKIGFGVEAEDRTNGTYSRSGIYALRFLIDDSIAYAMNLDHVPADETKEIDIHYDFRTILQGWGKFQKLYVDSGNTLSFYHRLPEGSGIINTEQLTEGAHDYTIVCTDFSGNETTLHGRFIVNHSPTLSSVAVEAGGLRVSGGHLTLATRLTVGAKRYGTPTWTERVFSPAKENASDSSVVLPFDPSRYDIVRVIAENQWKAKTAPVFAFPGKPTEDARKVYCRTEILPTYVRFTINSTGVFTATPLVHVQEGSVTRDVPMTPSDLYTYGGIYVPGGHFAGRREVNVSALVNGKPSSTRDSFLLYSIPVGARGAFTTEDEGLRIAFDSGAVYTTLQMQVTSEAFKQSPVYILEPQDQLLNGGLRVTVPITEGLSREGLGLYFRANGGWLFQTGRADSGGTTFTANLTRTLGELAIMRDTQPPAIGRLRASSRKGTIFVSFRYQDNLSGVDADEIKVYIDGNLVIPEIDGEHRLVTLASDSPYDKGKHAVRITAKDRMGNETTVSRTVTVR